MGVELSIPDMFITDVNRLLPAWADQAIKAETLDAHDPGNAHARFRVDDVDGPSLDLVETRTGKGRMMPNSLTIAGLQHITHNLLQDIHTAMSHWACFHAQLKVLEGFLRIPERRARFVMTHLRGTLLESEEHLFMANFSEALYEQRWRNVIDFLSHCKALLPILAKTWCPQKFLGGVDTVGRSKTAQGHAAEMQEARDKERCAVPKSPTLIFLFPGHSLCQMNSGLK